MRYHEIVIETETAYFHGSGQPLEPGTVLKAHRQSFTRSRKPSIRDTELFLEEFRPAGSLTRRDSVFLTDSPSRAVIKAAGGLVAHIYRVDPLGKVQRNHTGWWSLINQNIHRITNPPPLADYARAYWSGEPCDLRPDNPWEYRCKQAVVRDQITGDP